MGNVLNKFTNFASMMENPLVKSAVLDFGIQWVLWAVASILQTEKFYDLAGSSTFLLVSYLSLQWSKKFLRQKIQTSLILLWAFRLGLYLFLRILKEGNDRRFSQIRTSPGMFLVAWTMQGVWVFVSLLPTLLLNMKEEDAPLTSKDYTGWVLWAIGFFFEVTADYQKSVFRNNPDNAGKFINTGLWSLSRHPNYFGEILMWSGLYLSSSTTLKGLEFLSVISPIFVTVLLTKISGIPMLEASGLKKWGRDPLYQQYLKDTPVLIPFLRL